MEVSVLYNKKQQKYEVLNRFFVSGKEYVRVKFANTRHEDVVPAERVKTGSFEDMSIREPIKVKPMPVNLEGYTKEDSEEVVSKINQSAETDKLDANKIDITGAVTSSDITASHISSSIEDEQIINAEDEVEGGDTSVETEITENAEEIDVNDDAVYEVIATNPKGKDITVDSKELESFCEDNKLDYEVVQSVLEGKQKTHRKWRFRNA